MDKRILLRTKKSFKQIDHLAFDLLTAWGANRTECILDLIKLSFTEDEMKDPFGCLLKLTTMRMTTPQSKRPRLYNQTIITRESMMKTSILTVY